VILFASRDGEGNGVEVRLDGVPLDVQRPSRPMEHMAAPAGSARLRLALAANPDHPDIYRVPPGSFASANAAAPYAVDGFRSAHFSMLEDDVRSAIARDFPGSAPARIDNAAEGTTALVVSLPSLEPGPGPAKVSYIFGATTKRLMAVRVIWLSSPSPTSAQRESYAAAGSQLAAYFRRLPWGPRASASPSPAGASGLVLFAGVDARGAGIEVRIVGIDVVGPGGKPEPAPAGPSQLQVAYFANVLAPDVRRGHMVAGGR
jgi:hypothetical protein